MIITFKSAVDWWYYVVIAVAALVLLNAVLLVLPTGAPLGIASMVFALMIGLGLPTWLLVATYYTISDTELHIQCGPFAWRVPKDQIVSITPSRSPISSPALSLNRLKITIKSGKSILVSPQDQAGFVRALGVDL